MHKRVHVTWWIPGGRATAREGSPSFGFCSSQTFRAAQQHGSHDGRLSVPTQRIIITITYQIVDIGITWLRTSHVH